MLESIKTELLRLFRGKLIDAITIRIIFDFLVKINKECPLCLAEKDLHHVIAAGIDTTRKDILESFEPIFLVHIGNYQFRITDMQRGDAIQIYDALSYLVHIKAEEVRDANPT